jgi:hypothetical protein
LLDALWVYSALEQAATPLRLPHEVSRISHMEVPLYAGNIGWKMAVQGKRPALRKQQEAPAAPCEAPYGAPGGANVWLIVAIGAAVRLRAGLDWLGALETPR